MALLQASPLSLSSSSPSLSPSPPSSLSSVSSSSLIALPLLHNRLTRPHTRQPLPPFTASSSSFSSRAKHIRTNAVAAPPSTGLELNAGTWNGGSVSSNGTAILPPSWSVLGNELSTGPCPRSPRDLKLLVEHTNASAFVFLETEEGCAKLGLDWNKFRERASEQGLVAIKISMREGDYQDQAAALPEAVRAVSTLVELGYKVHVSCTTGVERSPLVALGYLTFIKGMEFTDAVEVISDNNPAAQPHFESWEEAKTRMAAGDLKRVSALAHEVSQRRVAARQPGTPADDWLTAQQLLVAEAFERGVATDITLSDAVAKVASIKANRAALEELAVHKANAEKAMQVANASKDRIDFFARQLQSLKEKEDSARHQALTALREKEALARQVEFLTAREGIATESAEKVKEELQVVTELAQKLELREGEAKEKAETATAKAKELAFQVDRLRQAEATAKKEAQVANSKLETVLGKLTTMQSSLTEAQAARESANQHVKELLNQISQASSSSKDAKTMAEKISELSNLESAATASAALAKERVDFFQRQVAALKDREAITRDQVKVANAKLVKLGEELESTARREASAKEQVVLLQGQVSQLSQQVKTLETEATKKVEKPVEKKPEVLTTVQSSTTDNAEVKKLLEELAVAQKRETKALETATFAQDQVQFLHRRIENLKQKEAKAIKQMEERMETFQREVMAKAQREVQQKTAVALKEMSSKLESVQKASSKAIEASNVAKEQVDFFHRRLDLIKIREEKAKQTTEERIKVFTSQVSQLREKLAAADVAAAEADKKISSLSSQVAELEKKEIAFAEAAKAAGLRVEFFFRHIEQLKEKEAAARNAAAQAHEQTKLLYRKVADLERKEAQAAAMTNKYREKVAEMTQSTTELNTELQQVKERETMLLGALEDGTGIIKIAMEADETVKQLRKEAAKMASDLTDARIRADRLAAELEQYLVVAGKKPRHWNDVDKSSFTEKEVEQQLISRMSTMQTSMAASGTAVGTAVAVGEETSETEILKTLVLGALGVAAVPFTLMSMFTGNSANPNVIGAMGQPSAVSSGQESAAPTPVEEILSGPIIQGTSPEEFCAQVPSGLRSARTDKFCNTILEASALSLPAVQE